MPSESCRVCWNWFCCGSALSHRPLENISAPLTRLLTAGIAIDCCKLYKLSSISIGTDTSIGASLVKSQIFMTYVTRLRRPAEKLSCGQTLTLRLRHSLSSASQSILAILTSARPGNSFLARSSHTGASLLQWPHLRRRERTAAPRSDRGYLK